MRVGSTLPVLTSAIGRVFLAYLPRAQTAALAGKEQRQKHSRRLDRVDDVTRAVRAAGLARIDSFLLPEVVAAACPILDHQGTPAAVVGILSLSRVDRFSEGGATIKALRRFALGVSERLGHQPAVGGA
jgi:DNA-binding IclR family transcriptional regulator